MPKPLDIPVPDLTGHRALITGASDGVGFEIAARLARAGADVIMPVRNEKKGEDAAERIRARVPGARLTVGRLDLSSLQSVADFAGGLVDAGEPLHIQINNAGVMTPPTRRVSVDGFELQLATNHLGHFALTSHLMPLLRAGHARTVHQVSVAADEKAVAWDDINSERRYVAREAYSSSKILFGLFAVELQRRSTAQNWGITSVLSHPGITPTNLLSAQPGMGRERDTVAVRVIRAMSRWGVLVGTPTSAALSAVYAATHPDVRGGRMYAPSGPGRLGGPPAEQRLFSRLADAADARRGWELSEALTGIRFAGVRGITDPLHG